MKKSLPNMKSLLILISIIAYNQKHLAQNVNIPDVNFKNYLLNDPSINTNNDTEIQITEANSFTGSINIESVVVSDITGISDFTSITSLYCGGRMLMNLDISANTALTYLSCYGNGLNNLNISSNTALNYLDCGDNQLTTLDLSFNPSIVSLYCYNNNLTSLNLSNLSGLATLSCNHNQLTNLNVSSNTALIALYGEYNSYTSILLNSNTALSILDIGFNQIPNLDLSNNISLTSLFAGSAGLNSLNMKNGNNTNMTYFSVPNNPNLTCIEVDNAAYSATNWAFIDATAYFSSNCGTSTNINNTIKNNHITIGPNPSHGLFEFKNENNVISELTISNSFGEIIHQSILKSVNTRIDLREQSNGIYYYKLIDNNQNITSGKLIIKD